MHEPAQRLRDSVVTVSGGVLVDQRGPRARMPEAGHQFLQAPSSGGCQSPAHVPEIVTAYDTRQAYQSERVHQGVRQVRASPPRRLTAELEDQLHSAYSTATA
jgi:hypothetical protein